MTVRSLWQDARNDDCGACLILLVQLAIGPQAKGSAQGLLQKFAEACGDVDDRCTGSERLKRLEEMKN
jgi:hypothetical protein